MKIGLLSLLLFPLLWSCSLLDDNQQYIVHFMAKRGQQVNGADFHLVHVGDGVKLYNNADGQFVLLADTVYNRTLQGNRVLAFSTEGEWGKDFSMKKFFAYYERTLQLAYHQRIVLPKTDFQHVVSPLFDHSWGQGAPYNDECPNGALAGCVPVAMAHIAHFHQSTSNRARLIAEIGRMVGTHYSSKLSVASTFNIKPAWLRLGYSAQCRYLSRLTRQELQQICEGDLQKGWPVMLSNGTHAFVCDGLMGDYLHLRMEWNGMYDGYYRLLPAGKLSWEPNMVSSVVCHLRPQDYPYIDRKVHVATPGTLAQELGADSLIISSLTVTGLLNGADVKLIRRMGGAASNRLESIGSLRRLDWSSARLQQGDSYRTVDAVATGYRYRKKGEEFDFKQMTPQRWKRFCSLGYDNRPGYRTERTADGRYIVHFTLKDLYDDNLLLGCDNIK